MNEGPGLQGGASSAARERLCALGWTVLSPAQALQLRGSTREALLTARLLQVLQNRRFEYRGQWHALSPAGIEQVLRELQAIHPAEGLLAANERLYHKLVSGITVTEFMPDGRKHQPTVAVIDWTEPSANRWELAESPPLLSAGGTHHRAPDLVGYVNGLPLVVIEVQRSSVGSPGDGTLDEAIARQLRHQRHDEVPQLFVPAQLLLALGETGARYGTTGTPTSAWARWCEEKVMEEEGGAAAPAAGCDRLLGALLTPARLLGFLRCFVLFDRRAGKVVARQHQVLAAHALLARIQQRRSDGARKGGTVGFAPGSRASLTLVFLARALAWHPSAQACRVLVVTDRPELDALVARDVPVSASGRVLAAHIGHGSERLLVTRWTRFASALRRPECHNPSADWVVLLDEATGSPRPGLHERLRTVLPRAACVAFSMTPWQVGEDTDSAFGQRVHGPFAPSAFADGGPGAVAREPQAAYRLASPVSPMPERWRVALAAHPQAPALEALVEQALAEHVLHPQNLEAAIRQALLPPLFAERGLAGAKALIERVIDALREARAVDKN